ncbi:hypothetical protein ACRRTK_018930 [Alexandromys fortis]
MTRRRSAPASWLLLSLLVRICSLTLLKDGRYCVKILEKFSVLSIRHLGSGSETSVLLISLFLLLLACFGVRRGFLLAASDSSEVASGRIWSFCSTRWCLCLFKKADVHVDHATDKLFVVASLIKNEKPMSLKTASGWSHLQDDRFLD